MHGVETALSELEESCTISILTDAAGSNGNTSQTCDEQQCNIGAILKSMNQTLSTSLETRIAYHYQLVLSSNLCSGTLNVKAPN